MKKNILLLTVILFSLAGCGTTSTPSPTATTNSKTETTNSVAVTNSAPISDITTNPLQDKPLPTATFETTFALEADKTSAKVGELITITLQLSGAQENVTTVATNLLYDAKLLKAEKIDTSTSKFPMVVKSDKDKTPGIIDLSMSNNEGGVTGDNIPVVSVQFRVLAAGETSVNIDGNKTSVLLVNNANVAPLVETLPTVNLVLSGSAKVKR